MRTKNVPAATMDEDIVHVHHIPGRSVTVSLGIGSMVTEQVYVYPLPPGAEPVEPPKRSLTYFKAIGPGESFTIEGDDYDELMSANPSWAQGKKAGKFHLDDLWTFIDRQRAAQ